MAEDLDKVAEERSRTLQSTETPLTVSTLHQRVAALEKGSQVSTSDYSAEIAALLERVSDLEAIVGTPQLPSGEEPEATSGEGQ